MVLLSVPIVGIRQSDSILSKLTLLVIVATISIIYVEVSAISEATFSQLHNLYHKYILLARNMPESETCYELSQY